MSALTDSVGRNGANLKQDVMRVQRLLRTAGFDPGPDDGFCNDQTIAAIREFQKGFLEQPDGLVEIEGPTWQRLAEAQLQAINEERG
jgi:peptidoglycan hydrolase-like protein with peptidoglycan-binding domain